VTPGIAIWLGVLLVLVLLFVFVVRRISGLVTQTRDLEGFQRQVAELDAAFASVAEPLIGALDDIVRNRMGDPTHVAGELPHGAAALRETADRARRLEAPAGLGAEATSIVRELDRAARAADLAARGLEGLLAARNDRQGEWTVDLKRGSLNLRNARETVRGVTSRVMALTTAELLARRDSPWNQPAGAPRVYRVDGTDEDPPDTFEPRM
jgi:hypothetical protein